MSRFDRVASFTLLLSAGLGAQSTDWTYLLELSARTGHGMAYDAARERVVITGGSAGSARSDSWEWDGSGWRPRAFAWPLVGHGMAYDMARRRLVIFGGGDNRPGLSDATTVSDGGEWQVLNPAVRPPARGGHAMTYDVRRERVVLFGGASNSGLMRDTWEWDGTVWRSRPTSGGPPASLRPRLTYDLARGVSVLCSGLETWEWDGQSWRQRAAPPARLLDFGWAYDVTRRVCVAYDGPSQMLFEWDGKAWGHRTPSRSPPVRTGARLAYDVARRRVLLFGGSTEDLWSWDGARWALESAGGRPTPRDGHAMAASSASDEVLLFGGSDHTDALLADTWVWSEHRWSRCNPGAAPTPREDHALVTVPPGAIAGHALLFGGRDRAGVLGDAWRWSFAAAKWTRLRPATSPPWRARHAMAHDPVRNRVVLFGGRGTNRLFADTWEWTGTDWSQRNPTTQPPARSGHAMAYDPVRRGIVLFGGDGTSQALDDTWLWDGTTWTQLQPTTKPSARADHAMVHDSSKNRVLLFGGSRFETDTWSWSGTGWSRVRAQRTPTVGNPAMAWSTQRGSALLFQSDKRVRQAFTLMFGSGRRADVTRRGRGCTGSRGIPTLASTQPLLGTLIHLEIADTRANTPIVVGLSASELRRSLGPCTLLLADPIILRATTANAWGTARYTLKLSTNPAFLGRTLLSQAFPLDPGANPLGLTATNAVRLTLGY